MTFWLHFILLADNFPLVNFRDSLTSKVAQMNSEGNDEIDFDIEGISESLSMHLNTETEGEYLFQESALVKAIADHRIADVTRRCYNSHISQLNKWLETYYPDQILITNEKLQPIIPLSRKVFMKFLADVPFLNKFGVRKPAGSMSISKSALIARVHAVRSLYREAKMSMDNELSAEVNNYIRSYKRTVITEPKAATRVLVGGFIIVAMVVVVFGLLVMTPKTSHENL